MKRPPSQAKVLPYGEADTLRNLATPFKDFDPANSDPHRRQEAAEFLARLIPFLVEFKS
jgi:hypothetical protein